MISYEFTQKTLLQNILDSIEDLHPLPALSEAQGCGKRKGSPGPDQKEKMYQCVDHHGFQHYEAWTD